MPIIQAVRVNGRIYKCHDNGTLYPMVGKGFVNLNRMEHKALIIYMQFGETAKAELILNKIKISKITRFKARRVLFLEALGELRSDLISFWKK